MAGGAGSAFDAAAVLDRAIFAIATVSVGRDLFTVIIVTSCRITMRIVGSSSNRHTLCIQRPGLMTRTKRSDSHRLHTERHAQKQQ